MPKDPLIETAQKTFTDAEIIQLIKTSQIIFDRSTEPSASQDISQELVKELQQYYARNDYKTLLMLWHDNYNSLMIMSKQTESENCCSYLVRHKINALGILLSEIFV